MYVPAKRFNVVFPVYCSVFLLIVLTITHHLSDHLNKCQKLPRRLFYKLNCLGKCRDGIEVRKQSIKTHLEMLSFHYFWTANCSGVYTQISSMWKVIIFSRSEIRNVSLGSVKCRILLQFQNPNQIMCRPICNFIDCNITLPPRLKRNRPAVVKKKKKR